MNTKSLTSEHDVIHAVRSFKHRFTSGSKSNFKLKSLILAQIERWRQA